MRRTVVPDDEGGTLVFGLTHRLPVADVARDLVEWAADRERVGGAAG